MNSDGALRSLLRANPNAIVAAMGAAGRLVPVPQSVPLDGHSVFDGRLAVELLIPDDRVAIVEAWTRAQHEPVVEVKVHFLAEPDRSATVHLLDVRHEHGVHVVVLEGQNLDVVLRSSAVRATMRQRIARVKRDAVGAFLEVDADTIALLGWSARELVGHSTVEFIHPDDAHEAIDSWLSMRQGRGSRVRVRMRHADGHYLWLEVTNDNHLDDPTIGCVVSEMVDVSAEVAQLEALRHRERLLARLAEALPIGICHLRLDGEVVYVNEPFVALFGGVRRIDDLLRRVAPIDCETVEGQLRSAFSGSPGQHEVCLLSDSAERRCELTFRTMTDDDGIIDGVIVCAADVTDRSRLRAELEHRANHDALTGCLNRAATAAAVERLLLEARHVAVAFIDLDDFKSINDDIGHAAGDELLRIATARLRGVTRDGDLLGRLGGDEFVVVCSGAAALDPSELAARLTDALNGDVVVAGQRVTLRASVGAAISVDGELGPEGLLHRADAAMYAAKRRARAACVP